MGKILIGSDALSKVYVGSSEVSKMILNGSTVYEKQAPAPTGHNLTINFVARNYAGGVGENYLRIKLNEIPSSDADYDGYFATPWAGSTGYFDLDDVQVVDVGYTTGGTYTINNVSSFTYWHEYENYEGDFIGVNSNTMPAPDWSNKVTTPLTQDTTITVYYDYDN